MKTKIELTPEQRDLLCGHEERLLRAKFEKDLAAIKSKYAFIEIEIQSDTKTEKVKLTDEMFKQYTDEGLTINAIADKTGYNKAYLYKFQKKQKKVLSEK